MSSYKAHEKVDILNLQEMEEVARLVAGALDPPGTVVLKGDLGVGKTAFARAFIKSLGLKDEEVPSPTFTIAQFYETNKGPLWHYDMYRLKEDTEAIEIGIEEAFATSICLIEWPERIERLLPLCRLDVKICFGNKEDERLLSLEGQGLWQRKLTEMGF